MGLCPNGVDTDRLIRASDVIEFKQIDSVFSVVSRHIPVYHALFGFGGGIACYTSYPTFACIKHSRVSVCNLSHQATFCRDLNEGISLIMRSPSNAQLRVPMT